MGASARDAPAAQGDRNERVAKSSRPGGEIHEVGALFPPSRENAFVGCRNATTPCRLASLVVSDLALLGAREHCPATVGARQSAREERRSYAAMSGWRLPASAAAEARSP